MAGQSSWMIHNEATLALYSRKNLFTWKDGVWRLESLKNPQKYPIFWLIGKMGEEGSVPWLESQLKDPEYGWMAAVALGLIPIIPELPGID